MLATTRDLSAALTQMTIRLDQFEHDYTASLDKLAERIDQDSSYRVPEIAARLNRLEQRAASPAAPISEFADLVTRLDKLEKPAAAAPAPEFPDIAARLDTLEKRGAAPAKISAKPIPPVAPKRLTLLANAGPPASSDTARPINNAMPLLRDYSVEDVTDGLALIATGNGRQSVAPGDLIPGAGRVLRIERRGGDWFVLTSLGVIASNPASY